MNLVITEPTERENTMSVGCFFILESLKSTGHNVRYLEYPLLKKIEADAYFISIHHVKDMRTLEEMYKHKGDQLWIGGGHVTNNPYPFLKYCDVMCVGEGETWIKKAVQLLEKNKGRDAFVEEIVSIPGTLTRANMNSWIEKQYEPDISINSPYLNKSYTTGHADTWYIEIARGCKSKCAFCELGWTTPYREISREKCFQLLDTCDITMCKRVNIFAPDDLSFSHYVELLEKIKEKGMSTNFGSMRVDRLEKMERKHKKNFLFRMGCDGLSNRIRKKIGKSMPNEQIIELLDRLITEGYVTFKFFFIFSYPFETQDDFVEFESLIGNLEKKAEKLNKCIMLRLKFTPFVPNPLTPMEWYTPHYSNGMRMKIQEFFIKKSGFRSNIKIIDDGIMEEPSYYLNCYLARCGLESFLEKNTENWRLFRFEAIDWVKEKAKFNIRTCVPEEKRKAFFETLGGSNV